MLKVFLEMPPRNIIFIFTSWFCCYNLIDEKTSAESDQEFDHQEQMSVGMSSPLPQAASPFKSSTEERVKDRPDLDKKEDYADSSKESDSAFGSRNPEKDKSERGNPKESEPSRKEGKERFTPLLIQTEGPSSFSANHLQSLALSGLHGQPLFNPLSAAGHPLLFHPSQFAMSPGAFSTMGMGHLLASMSGASALENGGLSPQGTGTPGSFPFHLSPHMLASQVKDNFTLIAIVYFYFVKWYININKSNNIYKYIHEIYLYINIYN